MANESEIVFTLLVKNIENVQSMEFAGHRLMGVVGI